MPTRAAPTALLLALALVSVSACGILDPQGTLTLHDVLDTGNAASVGHTEVEDVTAEACDADIQCVEAYSTAEADYFRFDSRERAREYGSTLEDGFVVNYFVMDFAGKDASVEHQLWAMQGLAGMWNDYEGGFPDRE
jgi:hypothetical protein